MRYRLRSGDGYVHALRKGGQVEMTSDIKEAHIFPTYEQTMTVARALNLVGIRVKFEPIIEEVANA